MDIEVHRFIRFIEHFEIYLTTPDEVDHFADLNTGKEQPLDLWYTEPLNVEADRSSYARVQSRITDLKTPHNYLIAKHNYEELRKSNPETEIILISRIVAIWRDQPLNKKFAHWAKATDLSFETYYFLKERLHRLHEYMEEVGPFYEYPTPEHLELYKAAQQKEPESKWDVQD